MGTKKAQHNHIFPVNELLCPLLEQNRFPGNFVSTMRAADFSWISFFFFFFETLAAYEYFKSTFPSNKQSLHSAVS